MNTNKAWVGAVISGLTTLVSMGSQMDFTTWQPNSIRDLIFFTIGSAVAGYTGVWAVPNKLPNPCKPDA